MTPEEHKLDESPTEPPPEEEQNTEPSSPPPLEEQPDNAPPDFDVYDMDLHDRVYFQDTAITRVPGGWIYTVVTDTGAGGFAPSSVFVPYAEPT